MIEYVLKRLLQVPITLAFLTAIVFAMVHLSGDVVNILLPPEASVQQRAALRDQLHLNDPLPLQYGRFLANAVHGDFGQSLFYERPAFQVVAERIPATLVLAFWAMLLAILFGIGLGTWAAIQASSWIDTAIVSAAVFGQSMPSFWLGILLILVLAVNLHLLPTGGSGEPSQVIMPAITLAAFLTPQILLLTRSSMLDVLHEQYLMVARAKGLRADIVVMRHALRNALNPVIATIGLQFGTLMGGAVITETIFAWPGIGRLSVEAIFNRDVPIVEASVLVLAISVLTCNLIVDVINALVDPRIRVS